MYGDHAQAKLLEHNVRFGDPECQTLMARFDGDLTDALLKVRPLHFFVLALWHGLPSRSLHSCSCSLAVHGRQPRCLSPAHIHTCRNESIAAAALPLG